MWRAVSSMNAPRAAEGMQAAVGVEGSLVGVGEDEAARSGAAARVANQGFRAGCADVKAEKLSHRKMTK